MARKRSKPFTPSVHRAEDLAETFYNVLEPGSRKYMAVAKKLGIQVPHDANGRRALENRIGRKIRRLEELGRVRHIILPSDARNSYPPLLPELEDHIREIYGLRDVVVVDVTRVEKNETLSDFDRDDQIHQLLGMWGARVLVSQIRPDDVVGIGSGRGVACSAEHCQSHTVHKPRAVVSLTGSFPIMGPWASDSDEVNLNSDAIIGSLSSKLGSAVPFPVGARIQRRKHDEDALRRLEKNQDDATLALIGIGALGGGHRLIKYPPDKLAAELEEAREAIVSLRRVVANADTKELPLGGHWIGDISNYLFMVEGGDSGNDMSCDLQQAVAQINEQFLSTPPEVFQRICERNGAVIAVAGGAHKTSAIRHVIAAQRRGERGDKKPWITHLITDSSVARKLLEMDGRQSS